MSAGLTRGHGRRPTGRWGAGHGQTSVEFALALPLVLLVLLTVVQVGVVVHHAVLVAHAAREGARAAAVDPGPGAAERAALAAASLDPGRTSVSASRRGEAGSLVTVTVRYRSPIVVPVLRAFLHDIDLAASTTMRVER